MGTTRWFLYDGDCGFCSACARFITRHIRTDARVVPWQFTDLDALGLRPEDCDQAVQWVSTDSDRPDTGRTAAVGPAAIAALLRRGNRGYRLVGRLLATRPALFVAGPVYDFVARHRDRMPGGTATCALPAAKRTAPGQPRGS
jgi:predicted DCC family thiol-disulfide oxidoreductase YuxK